MVFVRVGLYGLLCCLCSVSVLGQDIERLAQMEKIRSAAQALEHGEGVPKDSKRAAELYCDAAKLGDSEAQFSLGWMYANGRGLPRDDELAAYYFGLAAGQGHQQALRMLRFLGHVEPRQPECMRPVMPPQDNNEVNDDVLDILLASTEPQKKIIVLVQRLAPEYGVSPRLAIAVIKAESNFDPVAISDKNAQGLMQLIPDTAARFNVTKPFDPEQNLRGGLSYLRWLLAYFQGDVALVAAAYNAGEGAVERFKGVPPYPETQGYVKRIISLYRQGAHPYDAGVTAPSPELPRFRQDKNL
ncbi:transglycosylase SLT domain-containing protein [Chitinimonas naiadis]